MKSTWNLIGYALWLILIIYLVWMIYNMRDRRLKMIVEQKKTFSWHNFSISVVELVVFLLAFWGMSYTTFFQDVKKLNNNAVQTTYSYRPLVMEYSGGRSYYVLVQNGAGRHPIQNYTYFVHNGKYMVDSLNATVVYGKANSNVAAQAYNWNQGKLKYMDQRYQKAWVATVTTTYKKNFVNGLGLHAGRQANRFDLIRVPDYTFMKTE